MASISDIHNDHPDPQLAVNIDVRCRHCLHFKSVALYRVNGAPARCSSELIAREPGAKPCVNFKFDTRAFMHLPEARRRAVLDFIGDLDVKRKDRDELKIAIGALIEAARMLSKGLIMGRYYQFGDKVGRLMAVDGHWVYLLVGDITYKVNVDDEPLVAVDVPIESTNENEEETVEKPKAKTSVKKRPSAAASL